jgi:hypothetical protein
LVYSPPADAVPETATAYDASVDHSIGHGIRIQATGFYRTDDDVLRRTGEIASIPSRARALWNPRFPCFHRR